MVAPRWRIGASGQSAPAEPAGTGDVGVARRGPDPRVLVVPEELRGFDHLAMARPSPTGPTSSWPARPLAARMAARIDLARLIAGGPARRDSTLDGVPAGRRTPPPWCCTPRARPGGPKGSSTPTTRCGPRPTAWSAAHQCSAGDVMLVTMPLAHIGGVLYGILLPLTVGLRVVLMDAGIPRKAVAVIERRTRHRAPHRSGRRPRSAPRRSRFARATVRRCASHLRRGPGHARRRAPGSRDLGCWCKRSYGSTEMPTLTTGPRHDPWVGWRPPRARSSAPRRSALSTTGEPSAGRGPGEIWCRGPELFVGYVDPGLNVEAFAPEVGTARAIWAASMAMASSPSPAERRT